MPDATVPVRIYEDYICPFCYVGHTRLMRLAQETPLEVEVQLMEIHPETPPEGRLLADLGYSPEQRQAMLDNLRQMAAEEGLTLAERDRTVNSRRALLLGEAIRRAQPEAFFPYSNRVFEAYFTEGRDISDPDLLQGIAADLGVSADLAETAWRDEVLAADLVEHARKASGMGIRGVPTYVVGRYLVRGAVPASELRRAAQLARQEDAARGG